MTSVFRSAALLACLMGWACAGARAADIIVIDAGHLRIDGQDVALWNVDAPDAASTCTTKAGKSWPCGRRALEQVRAVVGAGDLRCETKEPGVALCRVEGLDLGALLVKEGLARSRGDYEMLERRARDAAIGIWE